MTFINILKNAYYCNMRIIKQKIAIRKWMKYLPILLLTFLFSFSPNPKHKYTHIVDLPDSYFPYKNLSTSLLKRFYYENIGNDNFGNLYKDSTKKFKLLCLDNNQKKKIIPRITCIKGTLDTSFISCCMYSLLVANGNIISSYILHTQWKRGDSLEIVDSVSYKTVVYKNGEIKTSRIDSVRYSYMHPNGWDPFKPEPDFHKKSTK
jgi:hypothetical protein